MTAYAGGDEYEVLLRYAHDEAAKASKGDQGGWEKEEAEYTRPWYAPWKKVKKSSTAQRTVPADWLMTDIGTGLTSGAEVEKRRAAFGWNELSRSVVPSRVFR